VRVIFDHNVPKRLRRFLTGHEVHTAREMSWAALENGELLRAAENTGFDAMVTGDKNLEYQQNLEGRSLALVVLGTNNWNVIKEDCAPVVAEVNLAKPGSFQRVAFKSHPKRRRDLSLEP